MGFKFKQFSINDTQCAMKVGTDSILLGAMAGVATGQRILDIGCGCGLLAIMLAQRTGGNATICAVEIDPAAAADARHNVRTSPWADAISVLDGDINHYHAELGYDLIISNPPYFSDSLTGPDHQRNRARHNHDLSQRQLLQAVIRLLTDNGRFWLILPANEAKRLILLATELGLQLSDCIRVHSVAGKPVRRYVMAFKVQNMANKTANEPLVENNLHIYTHNRQYSKQFIALTRDFYLNT